MELATPVFLGPYAALLAGLGPVLVAHRSVGGCCCEALCACLHEARTLKPSLSITAGGLLEALSANARSHAVRIVRLPQSDFYGWERAVDALGGYVDAEDENTPDAPTSPRRRGVRPCWSLTLARVVDLGEGRARVDEDRTAAPLWRASSLVVDALQAAESGLNGRQAQR